MQCVEAVAEALRGRDRADPTARSVGDAVGVSSASMNRTVQPSILL
jgi:hypothetical protein